MATDFEMERWGPPPPGLRMGQNKKTEKLDACFLPFLTALAVDQHHPCLLALRHLSRSRDPVGLRRGASQGAKEDARERERKEKEKEWFFFFFLPKFDDFIYFIFFRFALSSDSLERKRKSDQTLFSFSLFAMSGFTSTWVQCDNPGCLKWRRISRVSAEALGEQSW